MTDLAAITPVGRVATAQQRAIVVEFAAAKGLQGFVTPLDGDSPIDAVFTKGDTLVATAEVKARDLTLPQLRRFGSYLVTHRKLRDGVDLSHRLTVPYLLLVGLSDGALVWWKISHHDGTLRVALDVRRTTTQETCNGGSIARVNAYLALDTMRVLAGPTDGTRTV